MSKQAKIIKTITKPEMISTAKSYIYQAVATFVYYRYWRCKTLAKNKTNAKAKLSKTVAKSSTQYSCS